MDFIKELLYPRRCPFCDRLTEGIGRLCCGPCYSRLVYLGDRFCMKCGKGLSGEEQELCRDCIRYPHIFERGRSLYPYEAAAGAIFRFKYQGRQEYGDFFAEDIYRHLRTDIDSMQIDLMVPVPMHRDRLRKRGYNQAAVLGKCLSGRLKIPLREDIVTRIVRTVPQKQLNRAERQKNLKKAFKLNRNDVKLKSILVLDDIYTTGSTADALAETLYDGGAGHVYIITLASGME